MASLNEPTVVFCPDNTPTISFSVAGTFATLTCRVDAGARAPKRRENLSMNGEGLPGLGTIDDDDAHPGSAPLSLWERGWG